ncbi:DotH/IcmK family type IV secretion protein [Azohydromonas australica]|uniref:DotH/IcmK family type IV secretion protein n=1 Tax=Azohydromonas australica TaxID=364039 RepID=UPI00048AE244|nr:DotH/IcmK family type IV secretion protein [Azohydromonas australica]
MKRPAGYVVITAMAVLAAELAQAQPSAPAAAVPPGAAASAATPGRWVQSPSGTAPAAFPPSPAAAQAAQAAQQAQARSQQMQAAFPPTNYGAANYAGGAPATAGPAGAAQNGTAPLPPLVPPTDYQRANSMVAPLKGAEIRQLRRRFEETRAAKADRPVRTTPRIRSISVDLSPGATPPILRTLPGESSTVVFLDATGAPWPLGAVPRVSNPNRVATAEWIEGSPSVLVTMLSPYEEANLTAFLVGLATPVVIKLVGGEPDARRRTREVDYRLDLRVPGRSPWAQAAVPGIAKIGLYDDTLQAFLDGLPPNDAVRLKPRGEVPPRTEVWQYAGALFVRTDRDIQTAFDNTLAASDGTRVYRLAPTPYVTLSDAGRSLTLQLDLP